MSTALSRDGSDDGCIDDMARLMVVTTFSVRPLNFGWWDGETAMELPFSQIYSPESVKSVLEVCHPEINLVICANQLFLLMSCTLCIQAHQLRPAPNRGLIPLNQIRAMAKDR